MGLVSFWAIYPTCGFIWQDVTLSASPRHHTVVGIERLPVLKS